MKNEADGISTHTCMSTDFIILVFHTWEQRSKQGEVNETLFYFAFLTIRTTIKRLYSVSSFRGRTEGVPKRRILRRNFSKKKEGNLRKRRKEGKEGFFQTYSRTRIKID
jgi:hypothetical protein